MKDSATHCSKQISAMEPSEPQAKARLACVVESKEQWAGDGEGQDPDNGDHDSNSALGAVARVIQHGHGHSCVPAKARILRLGCQPIDPSLYNMYHRCSIVCLGL